MDAADYVLWKKNLNTNNTLANDNNLGTPVGTAHYDLWRANFGNLKQDNTPTIMLTGGELELKPVDPTPNAMSWQASMNLEGTDFDPKPGAVMLTNVGSAPNKPANFSLNAGSVWDLNIASNTVIGGADRVDVPNGFASLNGGTLNIIPIGGYTPTFGDTVRILSSINPVTLNAGAVSVSNPNWVLQMNGTNVVELKYVGAGSGSSFPGSAVPEPATIVMLGLLASVSLASRPARYRKR